MDETVSDPRNMEVTGTQVFEINGMIGYKRLDRLSPYALCRPPAAVHNGAVFPPETKIGQHWESAAMRGHLTSVLAFWLLITESSSP